VFPPLGRVEPMGDARVNGLWPRLKARLAAPGTVGTLAGMFDQVLISIANLAVGLIVLRLGTKQEFGIYGLGYTAIIVANSFAAALFAGQMTVSYYGLQPAERSAFAGALFLAQAGLSALIGFAALGIALGSGQASFSGSLEQQGLAVAILCCPAAMAHDLSRSYRFLRHQGFVGLGLDTLNAALWIGLTLLGIREGLPAHVAALGGYGVACAITALTGLIRSHLSLVGPAAIMRWVTSVWGQGRWAVGGVLVNALQNQAHLYLLAWLVSVEAVAEVNAARMLISPLGIIVIGVNRGILPLLAKLRAEGRGDSLRRLARNALLLVLAAILFYLACVFLSWDLLTRLVLRSEYQHIGGLVLAWAVVVSGLAVDSNMSAQLQVEGRFRSLALLNLLTAVPVLLFAIPLIQWQGGLGSLLALAVGQAGLAGILFLHVRRAREAGQEHVPTSPAPGR
jgi:O-antigen/teichoic acid export membrane protein